MNPKKHPLVEVEKLMNNIRPAARGTYCLYVLHHELELSRCNLVPKDLPIIARINSADINNGLSSNLWTSIENIIRTHLKQGVLEWQPQKH